MLTCRKPFFPFAMLLFVCTNAHASVITGPIVNPNNQHSYYLITANTWDGAEAESLNLGGHLATINDASENSFILSQFGSGGTFLWIGLNDIATEGVFVWVSGEPVTYLNYAPMEPNNIGNEDGIAMYGTGTLFPGQWNDINITKPQVAVVEVVSEPPSLAIWMCVTLGTIALLSVRCRYDVAS